MIRENVHRRALSVAAVLLMASPPLAGEELPTFPLEGLPSTRGLPDVLVGRDGKRIETVAAWRARREEILAEILFYQYGRVPPRPDSVTAKVERRKPHASGLGDVEWIVLTIDSKKRLSMRAVLYVPKSTEHAGRRPVVIREEGSLGGARHASMFLEKGTIFVEYARHDLDPDRNNVVGPAQKAYPDYDWATLAVWAWGGMRVVDYLETRDDVDRKRIAITGHSRGGKMALLAGALDERIALVVPNGSGAGGAGSYRVLGPGAESLGMNDKPWWYHERVRHFAEREDRLPFDQHFLKALIAPRALLCLESVDDEFANPEGTLATTLAADRVFDLVGGSNHIHFRRGKHDFNAEDWKALLDLARWEFFDHTPEQPDRFSWRRAPVPLPPDLTGGMRARWRTGDGGTFVKPGTADGKFARIGAPGNQADKSRFGAGRFGAVAYEFDIGERQVSNREYAIFLNAVARQPGNGLFAPERSGSEGDLTRGPDDEFLVRKGRLDAPVNFVTCLDAMRYVNWLHNGRPVGPPGPKTTEDGAYRLDAPGGPRRRPGAKFSLPSEDEWHKAAYFDRSSGGYCNFTTSLFGGLRIPERKSDWVSPLGVQELANDVWEWTDSPVGELFCGLRSARWFLGNNRQAEGRFYSNPELALVKTGFRVVRHVAR